MRTTSVFRFDISSALRIETMIRSGEAGFTKKSLAPACMACTTVSMPPEAVSTMHGRSPRRMRISFERFLARHARHDEIQQHDVDVRVLIDGLNRLSAVFSRACQETIALYSRLQQTALRRIVIDDQDRLAHVPPPRFDAFL